MMVCRYSVGRVRAASAHTLILVSLLLQACSSASPQQHEGVQEHQLPGWGTRRHLSRRLAAKPVWRKLQQSSTRLPEHTSAATAADSYSVHLSAPLTAAGLPARVFVIDFYKNRTRSNNSVQEAGIQHSTVPVVDSTIFTEEPSNRSASNHTTRSAPAANQWYNDQVSGVSYFGRIPGSNANQSLSGLYPLGADLPATNIPNGCPDFAYPLVVQYPTIFFTVALQDFGSSEDLGIDEEVAYSAAVNAFLAPTLGDVVSNTSFLHQDHNGPDLCIPSATVLLAGGDALRDFFQTTLDKDPNMVFPTAAWGQVRTSNIIYRAPEQQSELSFNWFASDYGNCSVLCGGGQQTRQVACMDSRSNPAAESSCPQPPPATSRPCQTQACEVSLPTDFTMAYGTWSACNSSCGVGSRTRSASCVSSEGYVGSLASCSTTLEAVAAQTWEACVLPPCPTYIWSYSDWVCDNTDNCGGGTAHRSPSCIQADNNQAMIETLCDPALLDNSTQPCAQAPCAVFYWRARELADCLPEDPQKPCGRYVQRRRFDCVNMTSSEVVPFISCTGPKPDLGDVECQPTITCVAGPDGNYIPSTSTTGGPAPTPITPGDSVDSGTAVDSSSGEQQLPGGTTNQPQVPAGADGGTGGTDGASGSGDTSLKPSPSPEPGDSGYQASEGGGNSGDNSTSTAASPSPMPPASPDVSPAPTNATDGQTAYNDTSTSSPAPDGPSTVGSTPDTINTGGSSSGDNTGSGTDTGSSTASGTDSSTGSSTGTGSSSGGGSAGTSSGGSSNTVTVTPPLQPVNSDPVQQLGPGQAVPSWLFDNPTPNLQALLRCPYGHAVNPDGTCCNGPNLDFKGSCCDSTVDACGVCNGSGKAVDSLGTCCSTTLDARGVCCDGYIDECGVCNGQNTCSLKAEFQATLPTAAIYLMPQSKIKQGLIDALQSKMASALTGASGRPFDKARLTISLSAYKPPVVVSASTVVGGVKSSSRGTSAAQSVPDNGAKGPQQSDADPTKYSSSSTLLGDPGSAPATSHAVSAGVVYNTAASAQPVFASISRPNGSTTTTSSDSSLAGDTVQQPMQLDTVQAGSIQHQGQRGPLPARLTSFVPPPATAGLTVAAEKASAVTVSRMLRTSMAGLRHLLVADSSLIISDGSSTIIQAEPGTPAVNSSNTIIVTALLASGSQYTGLDSGTFMMALHEMVDAPMPVPGTQDVLVVNVIKSAERPTVCGDGICQAGERQAVDNSKSCAQDCGVPFLPCPPFNSSLPLCNGRGVCYHSIGSCSCSAGYAGQDCSMCATNYKMVNGFCVAAAYIAPPKANSVVCVDGICDQAQTIFSSGSEHPNFAKQGYSSVGGIVGVVVAGGGSVLLAAMAAVVVGKRRHLYLIEKCREKLAHEAQAAQG